MKKKQVDKLKSYVDHLRRIQDVDKTWNFNATTIASALIKVNEETGQKKTVLGSFLLQTIAST